MWNTLRRHALAFICAALFTYFLTANIRLNGYEPANFSAAIEGNSWRPFAYRVLSPSLIRFASGSLSPSQKVGWANWGNNSWIQFLTTKNRLTPSQIPDLILFLGLCFLYFYGFFLVLRALILHFYPHISPLEADFWMALAFLPMMLTAGMYLYVYDPGVWLTFGLALLAMVKRQWLLFLLTFGLCTLNKESSLLLLPLLYFWTAGENRKLRLSLVSSTLLIWIVLFGWIRYLYSGNPGMFLEFHLLDQWKYEHLFNCLVAFLTMVLMFSLLAAYDWKQKPLFLRQGLLWTFWPLFFLMLFFGYVYETRDYYESFAFAYLLSIPTLRSLFKRFRSSQLPIAAP